ncbi:MAG: DUF881 domain-containing protein [Actinomycetaceae bacterium]|nr:DUF881 domain-containing protein [Actinomycetaceae bacterium]
MAGNTISPSSPDPGQEVSPPSSMPKRRIRRMSLREMGAVLIVTMASGLLFQISADSARSHAQDGDLVSLVRSQQEEVADLQQSRDELAKDVTTLTQGTGATSQSDGRAIQSQAVRGPGIVVTLTDAPPGKIPEGASPNDLVIHQQDIEDVMNAMWASGAEAMTVQGERVTNRTVIRCIGNVILVDGVSFSPPYEIAAIGDPMGMASGVESNPRIVNYQKYVTRYGLGWHLETRQDIEMPAATTHLGPGEAKVVK